MTQTIETEGIIDLHIHIGPEFVRRKYNVLTLARELKAGGMGAVLKNHCVSTAALAALARRETGAKVYGSVVLNRYVGGINKYAVLGAISTNKAEQEKDQEDKTKIVVWMPTVHAAAHLAHIGWDFDPLWGVDERYCQTADQVEGISVLRDGALTPETLEVLKTIAAYNLVLATGHLSGEETMMLARKARQLGVRRIIATHPCYAPTALSGEQMQELAALGVFIEHTYGVHLIDRIPIEQYVESIRQVGADQTVLTSDLGQTANPGIGEGFRLFAEKLLEAGITQEEIRKMCVENPRRLLD